MALKRIEELEANVNTKPPTSPTEPETPTITPPSAKEGSKGKGKGQGDGDGEDSMDDPIVTPDGCRVPCSP